MEDCCINGYPLIKFIPEKYVDSFLGGVLHFGSLSQYRQIESKNNDSIIGDSYEGRIVSDEMYLKISTSLNEETKVNLQLKSAQNSYSNDYVLCFFQPNELNNYGFTKMQRRAFPNFGNNAVIILDFEELIRRITVTVKKDGGAIVHKRVSYYESDNEEKRRAALFEGENIAFLKRKGLYEYQQEYRILLHCENNECSYINVMYLLSRIMMITLSMIIVGSRNIQEYILEGKTNTLANLIGITFQEIYGKVPSL